MTTIAIIRNGKFYLADEAPPPEEAARGPAVQRDHKPYRSPATGKVIEGRAAARDDLARSGCRIIEKGEHSLQYKNPTFAEKRRLPMGEERW
jgi:hypothetical protein